MTDDATAARAKPTPAGAFRRKLPIVLSHPKLPMLLAALAMALAVPSLWAGRFADDYFHQLRFVKTEKFAGLFDSPWDLFTFAQPELTERLMDIGVWPWWTLPELKLAFWRPLAALTHWADYLLWPDHTALMHAQSILWFGGLVVAATVLYRRLLGPTWVAGLAALLYAIDDARGVSVGLLANRNGIIAAFFGLLCVLMHDRWRRDRWRPGAVIAPIFLLVGLLSAEAAVGALAYLFAYSLRVERGPWPRRFGVLAPYAAIVIGWRIAWSLQGYGAHGIGAYLDPLADPLRFMAGATIKAPILLFDQWALPLGALNPMAIVNLAASHLWVIPVLGLAAVAFLTLTGIVMYRSLRGLAEARFFAVGMVLSLVPICATFPSSRMLLFVGFGAFGLLAQFGGTVFGTLPTDASAARIRGARPVTVKALGWFFLISHGILAPVGLAVRSAMPIGTRSSIERLYVEVGTDVSIERQTVVIVNAPVAVAAGKLPIRRALAGLPVPAHTRVLATDDPLITVSRPDSTSLVVRPESGYLRSPLDRLTRDSRHPMALGERVELTGMTAEVTELTEDGRPAETRFTFDVDLEDPSLLWLYWDGAIYVPYTPPAVGETIRLHRERPDQ